MAGFAQFRCQISQRNIALLARTFASVQREHSSPLQAIARLEALRGVQRRKEVESDQGSRRGGPLHSAFVDQIE